MTEFLDHPRPYEDEDNRAFLTAWRDEGKILLQRAVGSNRPFFYPRPICPYTGSSELESFEAEGKGTVVSFSLVRRPNHPAFNDEVPIVLAEIELLEGATMLARILTHDPESLISGASVRTIKQESASKYPLPTFELIS
ncbi:Zn-ribbon domain-containing OB-fold protein [Limoniibacter endophyticus]|uniref:ChsH2 C-terminal OB-fold domain-containing protein n=1 Tax=Limoniibacter endophyticus TaxID=1565040 RepID=A0A8J3DK41_9HYPH|nr:OB-fold domain-containing protein [Limoniibacter endophyticus]GHC63691.1 hypothetical protein GCM10010136_05210 [Limoniibacter endophyticus]